MVVMNCRQGRDCPVRVDCSKQTLILKRLFRRFFYWILTAILGLLWLALLVAIVANYA